MKCSAYYFYVKTKISIFSDRHKCTFKTRCIGKSHCFLLLIRVNVLCMFFLVQACIFFPNRLSYLLKSVLSQLVNKVSPFVQHFSRGSKAIKSMLDTVIGIFLTQFQYRVSQKCPFLVPFFIGYYEYCFIKFVNTYKIVLSHDLSVHQTQKIEG